MDMAISSRGCASAVGEWYDDINGALVPITVTAGDGSATGGGDGR